MDPDDVSVTDSPIAETAEEDDYEKQVAALQSYLNSVPYECETIDEMRAKLEYIVGRILVCAEAKNWLVLSTWDGLLQCWLLMRYPMPKSTRAKLVRLYYELCLLPGIEARVVRNWADMLTRLLDNKPGSRRKLEVEDLELSWRPLWRALGKELWPKRRAQDASRNVVNILLYVAEHSRRYYPATEIPEMLETFLPLVTQDSVLTMIPVLTSFLPPFETHLYLPALFKFWQAFNSSVIDDRMLEMLGDLAEEHVVGPAEWKDVGLWTEEEWTFIAGKMLGSMNVPIGGNRASGTSGHADAMGDRQSLRIKKTINRYHALAKVVIYSISVDGRVRESIPSTPHDSSILQPQQAGYTCGSKALDSLDRLITSTESFFHPSNSGPWSVALTAFVQRLVSEYAKRMHEEKLPTCKTPVTRRLTVALRRAFVGILRTPTLLAMFSKDPLSMASAQASLHTMAMLQPDLIMPEILERAYGGLEVVNETHRTTAVLSTLSLVALPLVSENVWLGGQKHLVPLLEMAIPGIDLNDPTKTLCSAMFIVSAVQLVKIGDLSMEQSGLPLSSDAPAEDIVDVDEDEQVRMPDGTETVAQVLSRDEERVLARESTAAFADWAVSLFRRVFALYENLPEEGGRKQTTGGKQEEAVLKSIKSMLDVVCLHLSDQLFDLVLKLVFDYATTNAKANSVRAFGQLVACLARVKPAKTIAKFLPFCLDRIEDELKHGASSVRTTSSHAAVPSDTTLHWNMAILRGCLGYGGPALLDHKEKVLRLVNILTEKTLSERGFGGTGRLITRIMHTLSDTYPLNGRYVNEDDWDSPEFERDHNTQWGRLYEAKDVKIDWHVPSEPEVAFILELLDTIAGPAIDKVESLLTTTTEWDGVARNDFCRYLQMSKAAWAGLATFWQEQVRPAANPCVDEETEIERLLVTPLGVNAGFILRDPQDPRYQKVLAHRTRFGDVVARAATFLQGDHLGEDHIDAVMAVLRAIDVYALEYGMTRSSYDALRKNYGQARDLNRVWPRQKTNSRIIFVKRAQVYHSGRLYMNALYRRRSQLDDKLLQGLIDFSISTYTRVRRQAQAVLQSVFGYYVRSTRFALPAMFDALAKGSDPDRMKGALYVLYGKGTATYAFSDQTFRDRYLMAMLECQHQEKPSIQKLVANLAQESLVHLTEEAVNTDTYTADASAIDAVAHDLAQEFGPGLIDRDLAEEAKRKALLRCRRRAVTEKQTIQSILNFASSPTTHWRYLLMATRFLAGMLRRDAVTSPEAAKFFMTHATNPHPTIRAYAQRGVVKLSWFIKIRTYAKTNNELWLEEWRNPLERSVPVHDPKQFMASLEGGVQSGKEIYFVEKLETGFVAWTSTVKGYAPAQDDGDLQWESESRPALEAMSEAMAEVDFFLKLAQLWSQESSRNGGTTEIRGDNVTFLKTLAKMFGKEKLEPVFPIIEPLMIDTDKFKQRASSEILAGLIRGSKHWSPRELDALWSWTINRLKTVYAHLKPDTLPCWEGFFGHVLEDRDPRRSQPLIDWVKSLPLEFHGDSAFDMNKTLTIFGAFLDNLQQRIAPVADKYMNLLFDNANTGYAEMRAHIAQNLFVVTTELWAPYYPSVQAFLRACSETNDPLHAKDAKYMGRLAETMQRFPEWREQRLPPPRTNQSEYDKVGLTLLQWLWIAAHGQQATLIFPYAVAMLPEVLRMSELNDSSELQLYSSAVLYVVSAVQCPAEYIAVILDNYVSAVKTSGAWRIRLNALPTLVVFFYRNLLSISSSQVTTIMDALLDCLSDENVEVREMASKALSGVVRCSQRQSIIPLKNRFVSLARKAGIPSRRDPKYAETMRALHSAILGLCALIESFPYSVEPWMPPMTDVLAAHATDPPPISTTIRKCASEFKKTHQDTWHKDQQAFDEDQLQNLSTMLVGTSYYA